MITTVHYGDYGIYHTMVTYLNAAYYIFVIESTAMQTNDKNAGNFITKSIQVGDYSPYTEHIIRTLHDRFMKMKVQLITLHVHYGNW